MRHTVQVMAADRGDAIGAAHPKPAAAVLEDLVNAVAGQAARGCVHGDFAMLPAKQATAAGAEPHSTLWIFMDRPHLHSAKAIGDGVLGRLALVEPAQSQISAHPEVAAAVDQQGPNTLMQFVIVDSVGTPATVAAVGPDPDAAIAILSEGPDVWMNLGYEPRWALAPAEDSLAVGTDPENAAAVAKDIPHADIVERRRRVLRQGHGAGEAVQMSAGHPKRPIAVLVDRAEIGSGGVRKRECADRRFAQAK